LFDVSQDDKSFITSVHEEKDSSKRDEQEGKAKVRCLHNQHYDDGHG
jgi:hypothetical protein